MLCCVYAGWMRSLQTSAVMFSPHWPAACLGEKSVQRRWQQSPHRPCSLAESGPRNPRSTQTPPRRKGGAGALRRLLPAQCLLSAHSLPVGCKATLTLIVMLWRRVSDWGTLKTLCPSRTLGKSFGMEIFHSMTGFFCERARCEAIQSSGTKRAFYSLSLEF